MNVTIVDHPLVQHKLTQMRRKDTPKDLRNNTNRNTDQNKEKNWEIIFEVHVSLSV